MPGNIGLQCLDAEWLISRQKNCVEISGANRISPFTCSFTVSDLCVCTPRSFSISIDSMLYRQYESCLSTLKHSEHSNHNA